MRRMLVAVASCAALLSTAVAAHHATAVFDLGKRLTLTGSVTEWFWANPHCLLRFDVKDANGQVVHWVAETQAPPNMIPFGWAKQSFASGEGSHVVLGRQPPTHFQTLANRRGIALRHRVERRRMVSRGLFEHDMEIDRGDGLSVRDFDLANTDAGPTKPVQGLFKPAADVVVQHVAEVRPRHGESKSGRRGRRQRRLASRSRRCC